MAATAAISAMGCFNSQPPEGGWAFRALQSGSEWPFQLTAARRRLEMPDSIGMLVDWFQLTAARRRLAQGSGWLSK